MSPTDRRWQKQGRVCAFNRQLQLEMQMQAYSPDGQVLHIVTVKQQPYLFTIGTDEGSPSAVPILKVGAFHHRAPMAIDRRGSLKNP